MSSSRRGAVNSTLPSTCVFHFARGWGGPSRGSRFGAEPPLPFWAPPPRSAVKLHAQRRFFGQLADLLIGCQYAGGSSARRENRESPPSRTALDPSRNWRRDGWGNRPMGSSPDAIGR